MADGPRAPEEVAGNPTKGQSADWSLVLADQSDERFVELVLAAFKAIYGQHFRDELAITNHALPIDVRALRHTEPWRIVLVLTPWMLARVFSPLRDPGVALPPDWCAEQRLGASYTVIGPPIAFALLGQQQTAYLNYQPELGHYLIQPLVQSMQQYPSAQAVYEAWSEIIRIRDETIRKRQLQCEWQNEVSRREFFTRFRAQRDRQQD